MPRDIDSTEDLRAEIERLQLGLKETEEVLDAIRCGAVDALLVSGPDGDQVYTLTGADRAYRILFETMSEGAAILGSDGTVFFCNPRLSAVLDTPINTILGHSILRFVRAEDAASVEALLKRGLQEPQKKEVELQSGNGRIVPCQISTSPFSVEGTSAICMILTDLTERKRAEEAVRQSEQRFRAVFEESENPIFLKDVSQRYTQVNPAFAKLAGVPPSEFMGKTHEDLFGDEISDHVKNIERRVLQGETVEDQQGKTVGGVRMAFLATRVPLREASGEIIGIITLLHDITDRKRNEASLLPVKGEYPSKAMRATLGQAKIAAKTASTILLTGESGCGKDYLAQYIHNHSDRAIGPYFSINCAAITPELAESELFGHERGAFTGAHARKRGLLELAEGGTLLLNEIGELSLSLQSKLLTFLDTRKFTRVGGEKEISVNARLITATNRDLQKDVEAGRFRKDLFYRLNVVSIRVPPLRERRDDITMLVQEILESICNEMPVGEMPILGPATIGALKKYRWPGNVRELRNVLERALILSEGKEIDLSALGLANVESSLPQSDSVSFSVSFPSELSLNEMTQGLKRFMVEKALRRTGGSRQGAAKLLGISRYSLKHYMKTLGYAEEE
jgi:PAS domain S-box-containing protein